MLSESHRANIRAGVLDKRRRNLHDASGGTLVDKATMMVRGIVNPMAETATKAKQVARYFAFDFCCRVTFRVARFVVSDILKIVYTHFFSS
jgi:hypothetical protein